jgi:hypothetical protein
MVYTVEMPSSGMIILPSFMKTATGVERTLRLCLGNLKGYGVGITDNRDL